MRTLLTMTALATVMTAAPSTAQDAMYEACARDDVPCRLDRLERTVAELAREWSPDRPARSARRDRSIDIPVDQSCSGVQCSALAMELCRTGGFPRGVPAEYRHASGFQYLVRATCMD